MWVSYVDSPEQGDLPRSFLFCLAFNLGGEGAALQEDLISDRPRQIQSSYYVPFDWRWEREPLAVDLSVVISRSAGAVSITNRILFRN